MALIVVGMAASLTACGTSTSTVALSSAAASALAATPTPSLGPTPAPATCPTAAKVGAALGFTVPKPVGVPFPGSNPFPAGASAFACDYHGPTFNVIIEVVRNIDPSYISLFTAHFPVAPVPVAGVGDQAQSFTVPLGGGKLNLGLVATKGRVLVDVTATASPATLAQIGGLVNQLL